MKMLGMGCGVVMLLLAGLGAGWANEPHCDDARWVTMAAQCCPICSSVVCDSDGQGVDLVATCAASATATCGIAAAECTAAAASCQQSQSNVNTCPACPDVQPSCARIAIRYDRHGRVKSQTCRRWATIGVVPVP